jgi:hypothetical protein
MLAAKLMLFNNVCRCCCRCCAQFACGQEHIFQRLKRHLAPGGRLYIIGMQPLPQSAPGPADIVLEVRVPNQ